MHSIPSLCVHWIAPQNNLVTAQALQPQGTEILFPSLPQNRKPLAYPKHNIGRKIKARNALCYCTSKDLQH